MTTGIPAALALAMAGTISFEPLGVMQSALTPGLDQVLDDLHLLVDVDLALGGLHHEVDAEPRRRPPAPLAACR